MLSQRGLLIGIIFILAIAALAWYALAGRGAPSPSGNGASAAVASTQTPKNLPVPRNQDSDAENPSSLAPGGLVSFSFDDGWQSQYEKALPILQNAGFSGTFYVISTRIGTALHMTKPELLQMEAEGNEIGDHTRTHPDLSKVSDAQAEKEITGARQDLLALGIHDISTFAYPDGGHSTSTPEIVKEAGLSGARSSRTGLNDATTDPYLLLSYHLTASTTLSGAEKEIDTAIAQKRWLIFEGHHIDENTGDDISSSLLAQIVAYVKEKHVRVVTVRDGLAFRSRDH